MTPTAATIKRERKRLRLHKRYLMEKRMTAEEIREQYISFRRQNEKYSCAKALWRLDKYYCYLFSGNADMVLKKEEKKKKRKKIRWKRKTNAYEAISGTCDHNDRRNVLCCTRDKCTHSLNSYGIQVEKHREWKGPLRVPSSVYKQGEKDVCTGTYQLRDLFGRTHGSTWRISGQCFPVVY